MTTRRRPISKRKIAEDVDLDALASLADEVTYCGSPYHKSNPGDFGLNPPARPQPDKTLCDLAKITTRLSATRLLKRGLRRGLVSAQKDNGFPRIIWSVTDNGIPLEARLDNKVLGTYHGYPLASNDDFSRIVLDRWEKQ